MIVRCPLEGDNRPGVRNPFTEKQENRTTWRPQASLTLASKLEHVDSTASWIKLICQSPIQAQLLESLSFNCWRVIKIDRRHLRANEHHKSSRREKHSNICQRCDCAPQLRIQILIEKRKYYYIKKRTQREHPVQAQASGIIIFISPCFDTHCISRDS